MTIINDLQQPKKIISNPIKSQALNKPNFNFEFFPKKFYFCSNSFTRLTANFAFDFLDNFVGDTHTHTLTHTYIEYRKINKIVKIDIYI